METSPTDSDLNSSESRVVEPDERVGGEVEADELIEESVPRRKVPDPKLPSPEEVAAHNIDHYPYRSWCDHCVRGQAVNEPHKKIKDGNEVPIWQLTTPTSEKR